MVMYSKIGFLRNKKTKWEPERLLFLKEELEVGTRHGVVDYVERLECDESTEQPRDGMRDGMRENAVKTAKLGREV